MKIISTFRSLNFSKKYFKNNNIEGFIIGLKGFNLLNEKSYLKNEIKEYVNLAKKYQKKTIVDVAKLVHEDQIEELLNNIKYLNEIGVDYFLYSDFGVYQLLKELGLTFKTILYSNTYLTNTLDTKIYQKKNAFVVLSNQVNSSELLNIYNNSYDNKIVNAFGRALIMYTRRPLLTNYFSYRKEEYNKNSTYYLEEEYRDSLYPIVENDNSTKIFDYGYYYLTDELKEMVNGVNILITGELLTNIQYEKVINSYCLFLDGIIDANKLISSLNEAGIILNKGAYERKLILRKGGNANE